MTQLRFIQVQNSDNKRTLIRVDDIRAIQEIEHSGAMAGTKTVTIATHELGQVKAPEETIESILKLLDDATGRHVLVFSRGANGDSVDIRAS